MFSLSSLSNADRLRVGRPVKKFCKFERLRIENDSLRMIINVNYVIYFII